MTPPSTEGASRALRRDEPHPTAVRSGRSTAARRPELLFADDEDEIRALVVLALQRNYRVTTAVDAREARALILADPDRFDVVLTDWNMPGGGGLELIAWIEARCPRLSTRIGLVTGSGLESQEDAAVRRLGVPCLFKPFTLVELRSLAATLAGGIGTRTQQESE